MHVVVHIKIISYGCKDNWEARDCSAYMGLGFLSVGLPINGAILRR